MASKFIKRNTKVTLDINEHIFTVDFGRDNLAAVFAELSAQVKAIETKYKDDIDHRKRGEKVLNEQKRLFKAAINEILQDNTASDILFQEDDSGVYHADIYTFLVDEYTKSVRQRVPASKTK